MGLFKVVTVQNLFLTMTNEFIHRGNEREIEVEELKLQEDQQIKDLQYNLDEEKRRSANLELQVCFLFLCCFSK